jgi:phosphonate transport system ATP-binding protein
MIRIKNLSYQYKNRDVEAIKKVDLNIGKGEVAVLLGPSGSGKSTLLKCINRLVIPKSGSIVIDGEDILGVDQKKVETIRHKIGMIFQSFNLVDSYTVLQNTLMGKLSYVKTLNSVLGIYSKKEVDECMAILKRIGLEQLAHERAADLSGGEKQRVGIARALAQNPKIILADEPVSSLDPKLMRDIMDILQKICVEDGITLIVSLHFLELARKYATRIIGLKEGEIVFDNKPSELTEESIVNIYGKTDSWFMYGKVDY